MFDQLITYPAVFICMISALIYILFIFIFILLEAEKFLLSGPSFIIHYPGSKHNRKFRNEGLTCSKAPKFKEMIRIRKPQMRSFCSVVLYNKALMFSLTYYTQFLSECWLICNDLISLPARPRVIVDISNDGKILRSSNT